MGRYNSQSQSERAKRQVGPLQGRARRAPVAADVFYKGLRCCIKVRVARGGLECSDQTYRVCGEGTRKFREAAGVGLDARRPGTILVARGPGEGQGYI